MGSRMRLLGEAEEGSFASKIDLTPHPPQIQSHLLATSPRSGRGIVGSHPVRHLYRIGERSQTKWRVRARASAHFALHSVHLTSDQWPAASSLRPVACSL
jgi:hypothetical protein